MSRIRVALVVFCDIMLIAAVVLLLHRLVNDTLYSYGLVFSYDWAAPYWMFFRITVVLIVIAIVLISLVELPHPAFEDRTDEE